MEARFFTGCADVDAARARFRELCKQHHPDTGGDAAPFLPGGQHHEHPSRPGLAFCRAECAEDYLTRESRKRTSQPDQVGLAF